MIVVGLAGGIATGKGVVARAWATSSEVVVQDADDIVHALYRPQSALCRSLSEVFGPAILTPSGGIDRKALGNIIFSDEGARQRLNALVHPAVQEQYVAHANEARAQGAQVFVVEAALLLDTPPKRALFDAFVLTEVDEQEQLRRLMRRDGLSRNEAQQRVCAQSSQEQRRRFADYVILTSGSLAQTQERARQLLQTIRARHA